MLKHSAICNYKFMLCPLSWHYITQSIFKNHHSMPEASQASVNKRQKELHTALGQISSLMNSTLMCLHQGLMFDPIFS